MLVQSAIRLIGQLIYKPGWVFTATDYTNRFESALCLKVEYPAFNSDRKSIEEKGHVSLAGTWVPETTYVQTVEPLARASFIVQVADCSDEDLYRKIIDIIMEIELHEAREFLRVAPTYWAPFHPHNLDGMRRWGTPDADLRFGLA